MDIWVYIAAGAVFFVGILVYVAFMIFLPEWVGISGKAAREAEASHRGDTPAVDSGAPAEGENESKKS
ncbi:MAG: hypothetical protein V4760_02915 [Bdellovibrionota bacterium]